MEVLLIRTILVIILQAIASVSGDPVPNGEFPWIVSIQRVTHFCAGSILGKKLLLTSASCVKGKAAKKVHARAGSLVHDSGGQYLDIEEIIINPEYNEENHINDVALMVTKQEIEYNENAKPVLIAQDDVKGSTDTIVAGWQKWGGSKLIPNLRYTKIKVYDDEKCQKEHGSAFVSGKMLCAGIEKVGKGMCKGDSGGPLIIDGTQYGVVSWGSGCEPPNKPGVYTDIHHVKDWIQQIADQKKVELNLKIECKDFECGK